LKFKKNYSPKANVSSYLQKKFQRIVSKIEIIGTYPNFIMILEGTLGPLGVKKQYIHLVV